MHEIDFLPVGDGKDSGDAIAMRFTRPDTGAIAHVIIDAGFQDDGEGLVGHVHQHYGRVPIDLAILTHPDGDHIGGMGKVVRGLEVKELWLHDIGAHGGSSLPAARAVDDLLALAGERGTQVFEAWQGATAFDGAITILGPGRPYYDELVALQLAEREQRTAAAPLAKRLLEAARGVFDRVADAIDWEIPFEEGDVNARNNSSMITLLRLEGHNYLFTGDAGVPALERAWGYAEWLGIADVPTLVQVPHHGSRRNASSAWLDRLLGQVGQAEQRSAFISVVPDSEKHPSGKVVNAYKRRGCKVSPTAGKSIYHFGGTSMRPGWSALPGLGPMIEEED